MIKEYIVAEFHNVLTPNECNHLIEFGSKNLKALTVIGDAEKDGVKYRSGDGSWVKEPILDENNIDLNKKVKEIVSNITNLPIENQEAIHVVHYGIGGEYKEHHDFFHVDTKEYPVHITRGGQRVYSLLFYLNDDFEGGETSFVKKKISIKPKKGKLLYWSNLKKDGSLDYDSMHAGLPVITGEKWIAIVWVRERKFA